jgi:hypothetical protein
MLSVSYLKRIGAQSSDRTMINSKLERLGPISNESLHPNLPEGTDENHKTFIV